MTTAAVSLNAPTGARCSLTRSAAAYRRAAEASQCTYRCAVLPDMSDGDWDSTTAAGLNAPTGARCSLTKDSPRHRPASLAVSMHLQVRGAP